MSEEKTYTYIGRFQACHWVHANTMKHAIDNSDHLIVQIGSSEVARDERNPFTFEERKQVIEAICEPYLQDHREHGRSKRLTVLPLHDFTYTNNKWLQEVQINVRKATHSTNITIVGSMKDGTSFYLDLFPQWKQDLLPVEPNVGSTSIRNAYFEDGTIIDDLPEPTKEFLRKFLCWKNGEIYKAIKAEFDFHKAHNAPFNLLDFPPVFLTGDAIVVCAGHILLIERKNIPGKGLWAMPGGYFDTGFAKNAAGEFVFKGKADANPVDTAIRELYEETKLKVAKGVLEGAMRKHATFADPMRSLRGRIVTEAVHIQLKDTVLPKVKGCTVETSGFGAFWLPLSEIKDNRAMFFEDHLSIIDTFLGVL